MSHHRHLTEETFQSLRAIQTADSALEWPTVFTTPPWLEAWWQSFGGGSDLMLLAVRDGDELLGVAPLRRDGENALFVGSPDVCDYLDCILKPGAETDFYAALLEHLAAQGVKSLELHSLRPESSVLTHLTPLAAARGHATLVSDEDVSMELDKLATWDEYLAALDKKQRGELRRKMRNLDRAGTVTYRSFTEPAEVSPALDTFLTVFAESRQDKAGFLTAAMDGFFRRAVMALADAGKVRLGCLYLDQKPVAMVLCFDHGDRLNLCNSGYDPAYRDLSVGLICKAYCVEETIGRGMRYDFLRGREVYKYRLGAREIPIRSVRISLDEVTV